MLSYLHGFHAGGAADVLKHSALVFCLSYLKQKEKPLLCVDTHAGAGFYDLSSSAEWEQGIGRLIHAEALPPMLASYVRFNCPDVPAPAGEAALPAVQSSVPAGLLYSGSPAIMAKLLEKGDRLVCFELHPREFETLTVSMAELRKGEGGPAIETRREDGPGGIRSLLPPPSRRGLVFIDPSWEEREEYETIPGAVMEALRRFPEGTFMIWYPLLTLAKEKAVSSSPVGDTLFGLSNIKRCRLELYTGIPGTGAETKSSPRGMYGSGLVIYNPPWTLRAALEEALPFLAKLLGGSHGGWRLDWEA
ncbi:MAG: 23S rRNA (adenine(2030)-N(6))-methyltransferase RlmJ [Treponema sp.]|nr:23S rRNA (adenine(2030)-N(6))-methyltransferase RlmJ [Treponema sp.]